MSDRNPVNIASPVPRACGLLVGFLTLGIGIVRSIQPFEIAVRAVVAGIIVHLCVKALRHLWYLMTEEALNARP